MSTAANQLIILRNFFGFFTRKLRLSNPWNYKVPFLICIPYLIFLLSGSQFNQVFLYFLSALSIIIGVAGIGYLTNDLGDKEKDKLIGKQNATAEISTMGIVFLFSLFSALALLPWLLLPFTFISLVLLLLQFSAFYVYAFKPFRFKEKGVLGLITDMLYAHLNPAILAAYTFYLVCNEVYANIVYFLVLLAAWQAVLGIRNILFHQLKDYENDCSSKTQTFVIVYGLEKTNNLLKKMLLPLEFLLFLLFVVFISAVAKWFIAFVVVYWLVKLIENSTQLKGFDFRKWAYVFLDDLYMKWIPVSTLLLLVFQSISFLPVLVVHLVIFRSEIKDRLMKIG